MKDYQNSKLSIHNRVTDLLNRMTVEEKVGQVNQHLYGWKTYQKSQSGIQLTQYLKEHVKWGSGIGALYGLFRADPWSRVDMQTGIPAQDSWKLTNEVQHYVIEHSRLGIPTLFVEECPHGHQGLQSVSYPTNIGRGNTFNKKLIEETSQLMAQELSSKGVHLALVSTLDLARDPRWGRTEECFGEDPFLAAEFSKAVIKGFQGDLITETSFLTKTVAEVKKSVNQIGVVLKHCLAQGDTIGGHNSGAVNIGQREFMEVHYPLLKSVKNAVGVMAAYNDIDGIPCHDNPYLFEELLRNQIGYQGIVMADGTALDRLTSIYGTKEKSALHGLQAGVDLSLWDESYLTIGEGVKKKIITEKLLDKAVYRVLSIKFLLGLFDHPYVEQRAGYVAMMENAQAKNLEIAEESITLLKNENTLPLKTQEETLAVIGPNANDIYHLLGDYTSPQTETMSEQTILHALEVEFNEKNILYAQGCEVRRLENQQHLIDEAIAIAQQSDKIILVLGGSSARNFDMEFLSNGAVSSKGINMDSGENVDVASLELGGQQLALFRRIKALGKPIITVLIQGRPHEISEITSGSDAVLTAWYPGQMGGKALAKLLRGSSAPSGKLAISYPRSSTQLPVYYYQRDIAMNANYYDLVGAPLYPFGYGESYTEFCYDNLIVNAPSKKALEAGQPVTVEVTITNTGQFIGKESILLFVKLVGGNIIQRKKLLRGFEKISLKPQQSETITFRLNFEDICYYDASSNFALSDSVEVQVGEQTQRFTIQ
nr:glycoside hydrolase family 3 N-terminal domain-containing protein [Enterococcus saccharolyticus]